MSPSPDFPRARAMLDPPGPGDGAILTSLLGLAAIAVLLIKAGAKVAKKVSPFD